VDDLSPLTRRIATLCRALGRMPPSVDTGQGV